MAATVSSSQLTRSGAEVPSAEPSSPSRSRIGQSYQTAFVAWGRGAAVHVYDANSTTQQIASFPSSFLRSSGDNTWSYVFRVMRDLIDDRNGILCRRSDGAVFTEASAGSPEPGSYDYHKQSVDAVTADTAVMFTKGPAYKARFRPPNADVSESTVSHSSRSTVQQRDFRISVGLRDHHCPITAEPFSGCQAAHIVPYSRPDVYQELIEQYSDEDRMHCSSGILVESALHRKYDRLEWSLYCKDNDDNLYVHVFKPQGTLRRQYHGKIIPKSFFRLNASDEGEGEAEGELPRRSLIQWHYRQAVQTRIRGFAYDMAVNAQGGSVAPTDRTQ